ncbi:MAG: DUF2889 domain-containing protein [Gammaproteobacteria bacterium]|nr:DUF2889 domain-containing protein [Gammaproteobacteria bacterium]
MPLSPATEREHQHTRTITCKGYRRKDGLWDIEAHMTDIKTYSFENRDRGGIQAGEPVHEMWVRISLDLDFMIHDLEAVTDLSPFKVCKEATEGMKKLIGLRIGPGWRRKVHDLVGRTAGCTHLVELLGPLATTAYQTMHAALEERAETKPQREKPPIIDTCHALASDSPIIKLEWPEFYTGKH